VAFQQLQRCAPFAAICHSETPSRLKVSKQPPLYLTLIDWQAWAQRWCPRPCGPNTSLCKIQKFYGPKERQAEPSVPKPALGTLYKCLFVVKLRVKAPPCGRSLAVAQVNAGFTRGGSTEHHLRRCHATAQPPRHPNHHQTRRRLLRLKGHQRPTPCQLKTHYYCSAYSRIINTCQLWKWGTRSTSHAFVLWKSNFFQDHE